MGTSFCILNFTYNRQFPVSELEFDPTYLVPYVIQDSISVQYSWAIV